jgi:hypothetical protein
LGVSLSVGAGRRTVAVVSGVDGVSASHRFRGARAAVVVIGSVSSSLFSPGFFSSVVARFPQLGGLGPPKPPHSVLRTRSASSRQSNAGRFLLRSGPRSRTRRSFRHAGHAHAAVERSFRRAVVTRNRTRANANVGSTDSMARLLRPGRNFSCAPLHFARAQLALRGIEPQLLTSDRAGLFVPSQLPRRFA